MTILALLNADGLTVGDTETGLTAYAYPGSYIHATATKRPSLVGQFARDMLDGELECAWTRNPATPLGVELMQRDRARLALLSKDANARRFDADAKAAIRAA